MAKQITQIAILGVTTEEMQKVKSVFEYSPMPLNGNEIIIEVSEEDLVSGAENLPELELGYNILHVLPKN